jgi:hypothetical protein
MKAKSWLLLAGLALSGLVWNGCYTQLARPDLEADSQAGREVEATAEEPAETYENQETDDRHATNVYVYDGDWYRPYWYYPAWAGYSYPRSHFYVSIGFGCYDPWNWCGSPWGWSDPWDYYYPGYWNPYYYGWRPAHYYNPYYYPHYGYRGGAVEQKKRTITRRGSSPQDDNSPGTYAGSNGSGTLARPVYGTFARGDDGSYRRVRRTDVTSTHRRGEATNSIDRDDGNQNDSGRRAVKRSTSDNGKKTYQKPANGGSSGDYRGSERRSKREPSSDKGSVQRRGGSGGSVSPPSGSGSSGRSAPPPSSKGSSNSGSSNRRTKN